MLDDDVPTFDVAALGLRSVPEMLNRVRQVSNILLDVMQRAYAELRRGPGLAAQCNEN